MLQHKASEAANDLVQEKNEVVATNYMQACNYLERKTQLLQKTVDSNNLIVNSLQDEIKTLNEKVYLAGDKVKVLESRLIS